MAIQCNVAIATYLDHLRIERGLSANSISSYSRDLDKYQSLLSEKGLSYDKVTESDISTFIGELSIQGLSPSSINRFLSTLKGFYKYCELEYQVANPMVDINQFKLARKLPKALSVDEVSRLIESTINPADPTMLRDRAILEILYGTGARVAELIGLDINDISKDDFDGEEITIIKLRGKGSKERLVPIGRYALEALDNYLVRLRPALLAKNSHNERALFLNARGTRLSRQSTWTTVLKAAEAVGLDINDISKDNFEGEEITIIKLRGKGSKERLVPIGRYALEALDNYLVRLRPALQAKNSQNERALFLNTRGTRLSRQSAWTTVLKAAEAVGLAGRVSPHVFRHSYATHLLDGGADIRVVQELLGHASVTTTQIYTLVTIDKVRESYSLAHPRSK